MTRAGAAAGWKAAKFPPAPVLAVLGAAKDYAVGAALSRLAGKSSAVQIEGFLKRALDPK